MTRNGTDERPEGNEPAEPRDAPAGAEAAEEAATRDPTDLPRDLLEGVSGSFGGPGESGRDTGDRPRNAGGSGDSTGTAAFAGGGDPEADGGCGCSPGSGGDPSPSLYTDARAELRRRDFAKALATVGGLTAVATLTAPLAGLTRVFEREYTGPIYSDGVNLVDGEGNHLTENALDEGEYTTVFPEPRPGLADAPTLLVRFPEAAYGGETKLAFTVKGYAAYSKVCTHAGCMVSDIQEGTLVCPCHYGKFDPTAGASVVGGPPPRALPQLPLTLSSEGKLIATGDFEGPIGPGGE